MTNDLSRRHFVGGVAAAGAAIVTGRKLAAQTPRAALGGNPRAIDCHHHYASPAYLKALKAKEGHHVAGYTTWYALDRWTNYSPAKDIEEMDRDGVATSLLSCTTPGAWFGDPEETRAMVREMNEYGARMASDYKGRFGLLAMLPLPTIADSLKEIEYVFDTLKADGVGLMTSFGNHWFGDPILQPVFDELNRRKAVVYSHPIDASCCQDLAAGIGTTTIDYNTDTARTILSLIAGGAATRYADIRFLFSHAGGTMPSLVERFGIGGPDTIEDNLNKSAEPNSRLFHLRRFFYDTAQSTNSPQMMSLKKVVGASQIIFGTDYPFNNAARHLAGLQKVGFTPEELRGIHRENVLRVVPQYKT